MEDKLKIEVPTQGWKQILTARKEMLDAYDRAREQARAHEVETFHGRVAEAACRKWLSGFLPKRYGVTSGYVVSPGLKSNLSSPHFDVIVFDQLESPVLWVEDNPDSSQQGKSLAIPVEYVHAVLEVKSSFSSETVRASIQHLGELLPVMRGPDDPQERYKLHLPSTFCCGLLFFELREDTMNSEAPLAAFIQGVALRGFFGGVVLRAVGITSPDTCRITLFQSQTPIKGCLTGVRPLVVSMGMSTSVQITDRLHIGTLIQWSEREFAQFAFDLLAMMKGTYERGRLSSFYGVGSSFLELMKDAEGKTT